MPVSCGGMGIRGLNALSECVPGVVALGPAHAPALGFRLALALLLGFQLLDALANFGILADICGCVEVGIQVEHGNKERKAFVFYARTNGYE